MPRLMVSMLLALGLVFAASQAHAKHDRDDDDGDQGGHGGWGGSAVDVNIGVNLFGSRERTVVRDYYEEDEGRRGCPPGLAKKHNGCLPPGQARKRYAIGRELDRDVEVYPLPPDLEVRLGAPPRGYRYGIVDGDVVKLAVGTLLVVDAIDGLMH